MKYSGTIYDATSERPLPFASVILRTNGNYTDGKAADGQGHFSFTTDIPADNITISAAGYKTWSWPAYTWQNKFELERSGEILQTVTVSANKKNISWLLLGSLFLLATMKDKKKIGEIKREHIIIIGMAVAGIFGFKTIAKLLEKLGIFKSQDTKELDNQAENPYTPWGPNFYKNAPQGALLITRSAAEKYAKSIWKFPGLFNDNEDSIFNIIRKLETQSQVSYLADVFQQLHNKDLFTWLRGGSWWQFWADRLSEGELNQLNQMVLRKPKYFRP